MNDIILLRMLFDDEFINAIFVMIVVFLMVGCVQLSPTNTTKKISFDNMSSYSYHINSIVRYENVVKKLNNKIEQNKKLLEDYEKHSFYYGRNALDFKSHKEANLRYYEERLRNAKVKLEFHRKMANFLQNDTWAIQRQ